MQVMVKIKTCNKEVTQKGWCFLYEEINMLKLIFNMFPYPGQYGHNNKTAWCQVWKMNL